MLPWYIRPYLHTLTSRVELAEFADDALVRFAADETESPIQSASFSPSLPRIRPSRIELELRIPPASSVRLEMQYEKAFLRYEEHPPDAHRGFDVPPAIIVQREKTGDRWYYTKPALVELAVPDFSVSGHAERTSDEMELTPAPPSPPWLHLADGESTDHGAV